MPLFFLSWLIIYIFELEGTSLLNEILPVGQHQRVEHGDAAGVRRYSSPACAF